MQNGSTSKTNFQSTRDNLTYINNVVVDCTSRGEYIAFIDERYMDDDVMDNLISYGYEITKLNDDIGTFITYKILWSAPYVPPTPTPTPTSSPIAVTPTPTSSSVVVTPTSTVTPTPSNTPTSSPIAVTPTPTKTPTVTPTSSPVAVTPTVTPTNTHTPTVTPTNTPTPTKSGLPPTPSVTPSITPSVTSSPIPVGNGQWYLQYIYPQPAEPLSNTNGQAQFVNSNSGDETFYVNFSDGIDKIFLYRYDTPGADYYNDFNNLINNGGSITLIQQGHVVTFSGGTGSFQFFGPSGNEYLLINSANGVTQTLTTTGYMNYANTISLIITPIGGATPTPTPSTSAIPVTPSNTPTHTPTPTNTVTPTKTPSVTPSVTPTGTPASTPDPTPTVTPSPMPPYQWFFYVPEGSMDPTDFPFAPGNLLLSKDNYSTSLLDPNHSLGDYLQVSLNMFDSAGNDYTSNFQNLIDNGGLIGLTQNGVQIVYSLPANQASIAYQGYIPKYFYFAFDASTITQLDGSQSKFDYTSPIYIDFNPTPATHVDGLDFTIEFWMNYESGSPTSHPRPYSISEPTGANEYNGLSVENNGPFGLNLFWWVPNGFGVQGTYAPPLNTWKHYAIVRDNGNTVVYVNGQIFGTSNFQDNIPTYDNPLVIGGQLINNIFDSGFKGKIADFRWTDGLVYRGSSFPVPTMPLVDFNGLTKLLLSAQNGTETQDKSSYTQTVTNNGSVTFDYSSPYPIYNNGGNYGSLAFDGTNYLSIDTTNGDFDL